MSRTLQIRLIIELEDVPGEQDPGERRFGVADLMDDDLVQAVEIASVDALTATLFEGTDMAVRVVSVKAARL